MIICTECGEVVAPPTFSEAGSSKHEPECPTEEATALGAVEPFTDWSEFNYRIPKK